MRWSLEELYFGMPFLALAWLLLRKKWFVVAGACMALAILVRASYVFPVTGLLAWYAASERVWRPYAGIALGALLCTAACLAPFLLTDRREFLAHNPLTVAGSYLSTSWPETNPLFLALNRLLEFASWLPTGAVKAAGGLAAVGATALVLHQQRMFHPFWHVCMGGFIASMLVMWPEWNDDYILMFVIPGLMGVAWSHADDGGQMRAGEGFKARTRGP